eukprot:maker-scaffold_5-snap-gene-20.3-mRNA-1 protein AED:0.00 eAED:0.00 QI:69/1/1/1/1/1/3/56/369
MKKIDAVSEEDLSRLFEESFKLYHSDASSSTQELTTKLTNVFEGLQKLQIFSKNEEVDDILTENLPYITVAYLLGSTWSQNFSREPGKRLQAIINSLNFYLHYLEFVEKLKIVAQGARFLEVYNELKKYYHNDSNIPSDTSFETYLKKKFGAEKYRTYKISLHEEEARYQMEISEILHSYDSDNERQLNLTHIQLYCIRALKDCYSLSTEKKLLQFRVENPNFKQENLIRPKPVDVVKINDQNTSKIEAFQINNQRKMHLSENEGLKKLGLKFQTKGTEQIKSEIFRPSHILPTMSLDEYADIQVRRAKERAERQAEAEKDTSGLKMQDVLEKGLEEDNEVVDQATKNDRDWDDWKDDNPKGSGVTKLY